MAIVTPLGFAGTGSIVPGGNAPPAQVIGAPAPTAPTPEQVAAGGKPNVTNPADVKNPDGSAYFSRNTSPDQSPADPVYTPAKSVEQVQADMTNGAQSQIDGLNRYYDSLLQEQSTINQGRDRSTSSVSTLTGLAGSTEANVQQQKTTDLNTADNKKIQAERGMAINGVLSDIRKSAIEEARNQRLEARQSADDILKNRTARQTQATTNLTNLAKSGVTSDGLKQQNPQEYQHLIDSLGGEEQVKALFTLNRPQESILDSSVINGKYTIAYQNPLTGAIRMESIDLGIPPGYTKSFDLGDHLAFAPDNWDGDASKLLTISKGMSAEQKDASARGWAQIGIDKQKADNASGLTVDENGNVIEGGNFNALTIGRYNRAANAATAVLQKNPTFKNILGSSAYLDRIEAAVNHPGSVGDQELLDAFTQLNTGGNRVTEAQVHLITSNQSIGDLMSKYAQKLTTGGALSADQRNQIVKLSKEVYGNYQRSYQPLYDDATKRLAAQGVPKQFWNIPDPKTLSRSVTDGSGTNASQPFAAPDGQQVIITD